MTKKLFYADSYQYECDARVVDVNEDRILLDQTVFFAFSGGQASDAGTIGKIPVIHAEVTPDKKDIIYTLEKKPHFSIGDSLHVVIDKERRLKLMRMHAAVHIAYLLYEKLYGALQMIGSNIEPDKGRFDFVSEKNATPLLPELEKRINTLIDQGSEIKRYQDENNSEQWNWQLLEKDGTNMQGMFCPCGGTHVKNTSEIGHIKLKRKNIGKGKERVEVMLK